LRLIFADLIAFYCWFTPFFFVIRAMAAYISMSLSVLITITKYKKGLFEIALFA
jgi:hypothetical protein